MQGASQACSHIVPIGRFDREAEHDLGAVERPVARHHGDIGTRGQRIARA
jgi:hypothetical protein